MQLFLLGGGTRARSVEWWVTPASATTPPSTPKPSVMQQVSAVAPTSPIGTSSSAALLRATVLVVDDNADMLDYVARILSNGGFEV